MREAFGKMRVSSATSLRWVAERLDPDIFAAGWPVITGGEELKRCSSCGIPRGTLPHAQVIRANRCKDPDSTAGATALALVPIAPLTSLSGSATSIADAKRFLSPRAPHVAHELTSALRSLLTHIDVLEAKNVAQRNALEAVRSIVLPALTVNIGTDDEYNHGLKKGAASVARSVTDAVDRVLALEQRTASGTFPSR